MLLNPHQPTALLILGKCPAPTEVLGSLISGIEFPVICLGKFFDSPLVSFDFWQVVDLPEEGFSALPCFLQIIREMFGRDFFAQDCVAHHLVRGPLPDTQKPAGSRAEKPSFPRVFCILAPAWCRLYQARGTLAADSIKQINEFMKFCSLLFRIARGNGLAHAARGMAF